MEERDRISQCGLGGRRLHLATSDFAAGLYIRKSASNEGQFTLVEPDGTVHEGSREEIAGKYLTTDLKLRGDGLRRSSVMGSGEFPDFNLS